MTFVLRLENAVPFPKRISCSRVYRRSGDSLRVEISFIFTDPKSEVSIAFLTYSGGEEVTGLHAHAGPNLPLRWPHWFSPPRALLWGSVPRPLRRLCLAKSRTFCFVCHKTIAPLSPG